MKKTENWICKSSGCNKVFKHKQSLNNHKKVCGVKERIKCSVCFKSFTRRAYLKKHVCNKKQPTNCVKCGKSFPKLWHLKRHISTIHTEKDKLKCISCNKQFARRDYYDKHIQTCNLIDVV